MALDHDYHRQEHYGILSAARDLTNRTAEDFHCYYELVGY